MADEKLEIRAVFEDDYSDSVAHARSETDQLSNSMAGMEQQSLQANVAFITQMQLLDGVASGYGKVLSGVGALGIANQEQMQRLMKVKGALDMVTGATKLYTAATKIAESMTVSQAIALQYLALAAGSVMLAYMAVTSESETQRAVFSALTGVTMGLAVAKFLLAAAEISYKSALTVGVAAAAIAAGITYAVASMNQAKASASEIPQAQTGMGQYREIRETGTIQAHRGEVIGRPGEVSGPRTGLGSHGGPTIILEGVWDLGTEEGLRAILRRLGPYMDEQNQRRGSSIRTGV